MTWLGVRLFAYGGCGPVDRSGDGGVGPDGPLGCGAGPVEALGIGGAA